MGNHNTTTGGHRVLSNSKEPLTFHRVHSEHIRLLNSDKVAKRVESFCKGICFSARPVSVGEPVLLNCSEISSNWSGFLRVGFTANNPDNLVSSNLPRYACPDMTNQPGNWAKALPERFGEKDNVIGYYVNRQGDVNISLNGEDIPGPFFTGVNISSPIWALIDIYGNAIGVEFLDRSSIASASSADQALTRRHTSASVVSHSRIPLTSPTKHHTRVNFQPLFFHATTGRSVGLNAEKTAATRHTAEYANAYVFTHRPIYLAEKVVIQIVGMDTAFTGGLTVGMTACDPVTLTDSDFPDDSDHLLDRPEYWVVHKDVLTSAQVGDELSFMLTNEGEVHFVRNNTPPVVIMHVDKTIPLWLFWDLYGQFHQIKLFGVVQVQPNTQPATTNAPASTQNTGRPAKSRAPLPAAPPNKGTRPPTSQLRSLSLSMGEPNTAGHIALTVELPPNSRLSGAPPIPPRLQRSNTTTGATGQGVAAASDPPINTQMTAAAAAAAMSDVTDENNDNMANECTVCLEKPCDCVVYTCGHMCMCFECATTVQASNDPLCPICRQDIKDVIRIFKS